MQMFLGFGLSYGCCEWATLNETPLESGVSGNRLSHQGAHLKHVHAVV